MGAGGEPLGVGPGGTRTGAGDGDPLDELRALVEEGYRRFATGRPDSHGVCRGCCMYPEVEAHILDWPVREIPPDDLRDWYFAASDNPFPKATIRWFLPRVLDLLTAGDDLASVGNEVVLRRLADAGFPAEWPEEDAAFMARYAAALVEALVLFPDRFRTGSFPPPALDDVLCMFATGGVDLAPALARLDALDAATLAVALSRDWIAYRPEIRVNAFWESGPAKDRVFGWVTSRAMLDRMLAHGTGTEGTEESRAGALRIAEAILRWHEWMGEPAD